MTMSGYSLCLGGTLHFFDLHFSIYPSQTRFCRGDVPQNNFQTALKPKSGQVTKLPIGEVTKLHLLSHVVYAVVSRSIIVEDVCHAER